MINKNDNENIKETKQAINKAKEKLKKLSETEHERELAELRDKYIRDQYSIEKYGYLKGKEEGIKEEKKSIAKIMLEKGIEIQKVIDCTGLTKDEVEKIAKK